MRKLMFKPRLSNKIIPKTFQRNLAWSTIFTGTILAIIAILMVLGARSFTNAAEWVSHTQTMRANIEGVEAAVREAESATRGYVLTGDPKLYRRALLGEENALKLVSQLQTRIRSSSIQQDHAKQLKQLIQERIKGLDETALTYQQKGLPAAQEVVKRLNVIDTSQHIRDLVDTMLNQEDIYLQQRQAKASRLGFLVKASALAGLFLAALLVFSTQYHSRQRMRRLTEAQKNSFRCP